MPCGTRFEIRSGPVSNILRAAAVSVAALLCGTAGQAQTVTIFPVENVAGVAAGPDGAIWFASEGKIGRIDPSGTITEFPTSGGAQNKALTFGLDGHLWFSSPGRISRMTTTGSITEFPLPRSLGTPHDITQGPDGNLWFTTFHTKHIGRITPSGEITEFPLPVTAGLPAGIAAGPDGSLWFANYTGNKIGRVTTDGIITEFDLSNDTFPVGIAAGPDGNLWFTENAARVGRISPSGHVTEFPAPADSYHVAAGPDGNLWFVGWGWVSRVTTSGAVTTFQVPTYQPEGLAVAPDGRIWVSGRFEGISQIVRFALETAACEASATSLCLNNGRFRVTADWSSPDSSHGQGTAVALTADSGYFWFFDSDNIELVVKVLDGCVSSRSFWVFAAGLTNVEVTFAVTDTQTGVSRTYSNPRGVPFPPIQDTSAFPCE